MLAGCYNELIKVQIKLAGYRIDIKLIPRLFQAGNSKDTDFMKKWI